MIAKVTLQHDGAAMAADLRHLSRSLALPAVPTARIAVIEALPVETPGQQPRRATGTSGEQDQKFVACATMRSCQALWYFQYILEKPVHDLLALTM